MTRRAGGFRGYASARMSGGRSVPQSVQQLVMRDYCAKRGMTYLLAATEYVIPGSTMMLEAVLDELDHLDGIVFYSLFLLPERRTKRLELFSRVIDGGRTLHAAAEAIVIGDWNDAGRVEDIWLVRDVMDELRPRELEWLARWDRDQEGGRVTRRGRAGGPG